jgi:hypothetical protein
MEIATFLVDLGILILLLVWFLMDRANIYFRR